MKFKSIKRIARISVKKFVNDYLAPRQGPSLHFIQTPMKSTTFTQ
jgi:hypothetical protein